MNSARILFGKNTSQPVTNARPGFFSSLTPLNNGLPATILNTTYFYIKRYDTGGSSRPGGRSYTRGPFRQVFGQDCQFPVPHPGHRWGALESNVGPSFRIAGAILVHTE